MKKIFSLLSGFVLVMNFVTAQSDVSKPIVVKAAYFDISPPLRDMVQMDPGRVDNTWKDGIVKNNPTPKGLIPETDNSNTVIPNLQTWFGSGFADTTIQNFEGVGNSTGGAPPDTDGDVGLNHYFQVVNMSYAIYNKSGVKILGPSQNKSIWNGFPGPWQNSNDGDAIVIYDEAADRWIFSQFALPNYYGSGTPNYEMIAVSQTSDPTGSWYRYAFTFVDMPDYPKISVWEDAYYMSSNRFHKSGGSYNYQGIGAIALNRAKMLAGDPGAEMVMFTLPSSNSAWRILPADCDGEFPPAGTPNYFVYSNDSQNKLVFYEFHVDWANTSNSTFIPGASLTVTPFSGSFPNHIPQKGTSVKLDDFGGSLMFRLPFRKFSDHWSMVAASTINVGNGVAGQRWYELRNSGAGWSVYQEGTYAPDDNCRWMSSIAMDATGNIALGYSISSSTMYPSIRYTGRLTCDPLGEMSIVESGIFNGTGSQIWNMSPDPSRWGDYSAMASDPSEPAKFWYTNEYYTTPSQSNWKTRIGSFSFAGVLCVEATADPSDLCIGSSTQLGVTASGGSGSYSYQWTSVPAGFTSSSQNPTAAPTVTTKFACTVNDGSTSRTDTVQVTVIPHPTANAGPDDTYCAYVPSFLLFGTAHDYFSVGWTTSGDGYYSSDSTLITRYFPGSNDKINGGVDLTLTAYAVPECNDSASNSTHITIDPCTGIEPASAAFTMVLKPNPAQNEFSLSVTGLSNNEVHCVITDMQGKVVYREMLTGSANVLIRVIPVSTLPKGIYMVRVLSGTQTKSEKLVIQ